MAGKVMRAEVMGWGSGSEEVTGETEQVTGGRKSERQKSGGRGEEAKVRGKWDSHSSKFLASPHLFFSNPRYLFAVDFAS